MRSGRLEEASSCARRIGLTIECLTTRHLSGVDPRNGLGDLWRRAGEVLDHRGPDRPAVSISADEFNNHYARISTDTGYEPPLLKATASPTDAIVSERTIFNILDHPHHTTTGYDGLPVWFLRLTAPAYSGIIAHLMNQSISQTHFTRQWKTAIILPIPKTTRPATPGDFRPISITPVLSRLLERVIVHSYMYIYPTFTAPPMVHMLSDQYAFRPTGSTTAALISIHQQVTAHLDVYSTCSMNFFV